MRAVDLEQASAVCMASFMEAVAPSLGPEGIATFAGIVSVDGFAGRLSDEKTCSCTRPTARWSAWPS
ncbi:hypothetical protein [Stenotrophomonas sp. VV52]|uniref:hypothetical protein n=1 Tax=Stenotrophomonas sp. VV52 TaxID=2066958 RepID=UPI00209BF1E2|nr:hypothetical protein [Stenotrophomonas sp. VV52]